MKNGKNKYSKSPVNFSRQNTSQSTIKNKSLNASQKNNSSFHCLYKSIRDRSGAENYMIYKKDKMSNVSNSIKEYEDNPDSMGIKEEYNLLEMSKHMEESFQKQKPAKQKLKKTLEGKKKKKEELSRSILYSKKTTKLNQNSHKRGTRNVSSFSRIGVKPKANVSIENRKRRRNVSNKILNKRNKSKTKLKKKRKKNNVILNNIDNSQNVYNNYYINVKQTPSIEGVNKMNQLFNLINNNQRKISKQTNGNYQI